jgi:hypothetical protein
MYMVYWTEVHASIHNAHERLFDSGDLVGAMKFMEELRIKQRNGEPLCFIVLSSENPDSVGNPGVGEPSADYSWTKRRRVRR